MAESYFNIENYFGKQDIGLATVKLIYNNDNQPTDLVFTEVNESFVKVVGTNKETIIGGKYHDIHYDIHLEIMQLYVKAENSKETFKYYDHINKKHFIVSVYPGKGDQLSLILQDISEIIYLKKKNDRINKIIEASRLINKLIINEKDLGDLLRKSCEIIEESLESPMVWIGLLNTDNNSVTDFYTSTRFFNELPEGSGLSPCIQEILLMKKAKFYQLPLTNCIHCRVKFCQKNISHVLVPLKFNDMIYGALNIKFDSAWEYEKTKFNILKI